MQSVHYQNYLKTSTAKWKTLICKWLLEFKLKSFAPEPPSKATNTQKLKKKLKRKKLKGDS